MSASSDWSAVESPRNEPDQSFGLGRVESLLELHVAAAQERFGAAALGVIALPPLGNETIVAAQVRAGAALYWCYELELFGVLPFVEALAAKVVDGSLPLAGGMAAHRLLRIARSTDERLSKPERDAIYARTLGSRAEGFLPMLAGLVATLSRLGRTRLDLGLGDLQASVGHRATMLAAELSQRSVGIVAFAARDIASQIREALGLLRDGDVSRALGGGTPRSLLQRHSPAFLGHPAESEAADRATAGLTILEWVAAAAPNVHAAARRLHRDHPVVHAAHAWRVHSEGA